MRSLRDHHIVHSDIKPDNFLIVRGGSVVLSDFGLAQTPEPPLPIHAAFLQWRALAGGTPGYLAPEAIRGKMRYVTHGSDIFSLGVVFVELLGRMDGLLWDVYKVPPEHRDTPDVWWAMGNGQRQQFLMEHHWLKYADIPVGSMERDLCEKVRARSVWTARGRLFIGSTVCFVDAEPRGVRRRASDAPLLRRAVRRGGPSTALP